MHRGKAHSKRAFAPKEVCLPPLTPTGQMGGPSSPHQTGGPAKVFRQSPLPWPGALPNALSLPQRTERRHTPKRDFALKEAYLSSLAPTEQMGGAIVPCPRRQPRKTLQPPPCQSVSQRYLSSDLPSGPEFFPLQISSAPPHKGSSLSQREECTGRSEPVSLRPGRADGGQTVPVKRLQQAAFFQPGAFPSLARSCRTGRATHPSKGDLVPGGVSIFPSRLDRAGGRGGRLAQDGHSRKKSSAVAFPQPGAPSTRAKSPTPLRGKGS